MKRLFFFGAFLILMAFTVSEKKAGFKELQMEKPRVKSAYKEKYDALKTMLARKNIRPGDINIFIRAFKKEKILEVWAKNSTDKNYVLLQEIPVCKSSGKLGPKKKQGDLQVPEGFYHVVNFNPESSFHLSVSINYPNAFDKANSTAANLGNYISIHGNCITIGCLPLTDELIKEVYILAVEAYNNGQKQIPVHIFPARLNDANFAALQKEYSAEKTLLGFWQNIRTGYNYFEKHKALPKVSVSGNGKYVFK